MDKVTRADLREMTPSARVFTNEQVLELWDEAFLSGVKAMQEVAAKAIEPGERPTHSIHCGCTTCQRWHDYYAIRSIDPSSIDRGVG